MADLCAWKGSGHCSRCKTNEANRGKAWCEQCFRAYGQHSRQTPAKLCTRCHKTPPNDRHSWCQQCFDTDRTTQKASNPTPLTSKYKCTKCDENDANLGHRWCQKCFDADRALHKTDKCIECRKAPPNPGYFYCQNCYDHHTKLCIKCNKDSANPGLDLCMGCVIGNTDNQKLLAAASEFVGDWQRLLQKAKDQVRSFEPKLKDIISEIVAPLKSRFAIKDVIMAGSWGKGTADGRDADLDLVLLVEGFRIDNYGKEYLDPAEEIIRTLPGHPHTKISRFAVQFNYRNVEVDLLFGRPTNKIDERPLTDPISRRVHKDMFSASRSKYQVEFIRKQKSEYKDLVVLAKTWRDHARLPRDFCPKSYILELVCLQAFLNSPPTATPIQLLKQFLQLFQQPGLRVIFEAYYPQKAASKDIFDSADVVLDVAQPLNNLCEGVDFGPIRDFAKKTLSFL